MGARTRPCGPPAATGLSFHPPGTVATDGELLSPVRRVLGADRLGNGLCGCAEGLSLATGGPGVKISALRYLPSKRKPA